MDEKLKYVVDRLNGRKYGNDLDKALRRVYDYAEENGIVIIYGDNRCEHDIQGAIYSTTFIDNETAFYIDINGVLSSEDDEGDRYSKAKKISVIPYGYFRYSFTYDANFSHETFLVIDEDDLPHCRGIVFYKSELAK